MEDYSKFPKSLSEVRSDKSGKAADWTVRDMLIALLREIDSGSIHPEKAVLVYSLRPDSPHAGAVVKKTQVIDSHIEGHGLLSIAQKMEW